MWKRKRKCNVPFFREGGGEERKEEREKKKERERKKKKRRFREGKNQNRNIFAFLKFLFDHGAGGKA